MIFILRFFFLFFICFSFSFASDKLASTQTDSSGKLAKENTKEFDSATFNNSHLSSESQKDQQTIDNVQKHIPVTINLETPSSTVYIAALGAIVSLVSFGFSIYVNNRLNEEKKKNYEKSIDDDFWYRTILIPTLLESMIKTLDGFANKLVSLESKSNGKQSDDIYQKFFDKFQRELNLLYGRCILTKLFGNDLYTKIVTELEKLEDNLAAHCYYKSTGSKMKNNDSELFFESMKNILEIIKNEQHSKFTKK